MIEDGKATITIKELDELRSAHTMWKEYFETMYNKQVSELEEREKYWKEMRAIVDTKAGEYLLAYYNPKHGYRQYTWLYKTEAFKAFDNDRSTYLSDTLDVYLKNSTMREIRKRKKELT